MEREVGHSEPSSSLRQSCSTPSGSGTGGDGGFFLTGAMASGPGLATPLLQIPVSCLDSDGDSCSAAHVSVNDHTSLLRVGFFQLRFNLYFLQ